MVAKENKFDVVLIDTAGRMQDNEPLMRALAKVCWPPYSGVTQLILSS
jgi:signal recognition particle GTPase